MIDRAKTQEDTIPTKVLNAGGLDGTRGQKATSVHELSPSPYGLPGNAPPNVKDHQEHSTRLMQFKNNAEGSDSARMICTEVRQLVDSRQEFTAG